MGQQGERTEDVTADASTDDADAASSSQNGDPADDEQDHNVAAASTQPAFRVVEDDIFKDGFDIKPIVGRGEVPEDQRILNHAIYAVIGVLRLLDQQGVFKRTRAFTASSDDEPSRAEFSARLVQVARAGLEDEPVQLKLATHALEQLRDDIVLRKGRQLKFAYLVRLAQWGLVGVGVGAALAFMGAWFAGLRGYGYVVVGAMVGAWMSVGGTRRSIAFEDIAYFLDSRIEPIVRMLYVGLMAGVLGLFVDTKLFTMTIGSLDFATFTSRPSVALLVGVVAGLAERTLSPRLIKRAEEIAGPSQT